MRYGTTRLRALAQSWRPSRANGTWDWPPQLRLPRNAGATKKQVQRQRYPRRLEAHPRSVNRDTKLYSRLLGWIGILTKSCVSPQVFYGSKRLAGRGVRTAAARGVKPSGKCSKPGTAWD